MNPVENHGDWMRGISGSRRMTGEATAVDPTAIDEMKMDPLHGTQGGALLSVGDSSLAGSATQGDKGIWARFGRSWHVWQVNNRPHQLTLSETGPVDWIEALRGILFFGTLVAAVWLEWIVIKAIATYFATYF